MLIGFSADSTVVESLGLGMEGPSVGTRDGEFCENSNVEDEEFRSCSADDDAWKDTKDDSPDTSSREDMDECIAKLFFKGVSLSKADGGSGCRLSGIGVIIQRSSGSPIQVQKKLEFYVEEPVAELLALMDGLLEARRNNIAKIHAFTDSEKVYDQLTQREGFNKQLLVALVQRISEIVDNLDEFVLELVPCSELDGPIRKARGAVGILPSDENEVCSACREPKTHLQMIELNCSHKFCVDCMIVHIEDELHTSQVYLRCPEGRCKYYITTKECKAFLPVALHESLLRANKEAAIRCPFQNCCALLRHGHHFSYSSSSCQTDINCVKCPECQRSICTYCGAPWHFSMVCEEYQALQIDEKNSAEDIAEHASAQTSRWRRRCQRCRQMIEQPQGCYCMTCRCGHEFCYACGAEYLDGSQTCQCAYLDEDSGRSASLSNQEAELRRWEFFDSPHAAYDQYSEQEKSQLAMIQRFLVGGGFDMGEDPSCSSPPPRCPDSYADAMNDLHQIPWLERFVSVISDDYHEEQQLVQ